VGIDGDIMPLRFAIARETRPEILKNHVMEGLIPNFPELVEPGDIIVAGKRFGQGNPHIYGFIGIRALGLGVVAESIPRGSYRNVVNAGVAVLPFCPGVSDEADQGDILEVDFRSGCFTNVTRGTQRRYAPLSPELLRIVEAGGWKAMFRSRLDSLERQAHTNKGGSL
jgi:3-isopropylmalate/(R)-2-methylmalate dehydratase small subunit